MHSLPTFHPFPVLPLTKTTVEQNQKGHSSRSCHIAKRRGTERMGMTFSSNDPDFPELASAVPSVAFVESMQSGYKRVVREKRSRRRWHSTIVPRRARLLSSSHHGPALCGARFPLSLSVRLALNPLVGRGSDIHSQRQPAQCSVPCSSFSARHSFPFVRPLLHSFLVPSFRDPFCTLAYNPVVLTFLECPWRELRLKDLA